ncbi:MAG: hypothetical protein P1U83_12975 [Roseovarius sp.]|nr:hypothetical protein [Roseovarius sp.]
MTQENWSDMQEAIRQYPIEQRYKMQPKLAALIREMRARDEPVPPEARELNAILRDEAVEAQFENMPV